eukprot:COSAG01_NODE_6451_length_3660_cov_3.438641_3_plen_105_part_00
MQSWRQTCAGLCYVLLCATVKLLVALTGRWTCIEQSIGRKECRVGGASYGGSNGKGAQTLQMLMCKHFEYYVSFATDNLVQDEALAAKDAEWEEALATVTAAKV